MERLHEQTPELSLGVPIWTPFGQTQHPCGKKLHLRSEDAAQQGCSSLFKRESCAFVLAARCSGTLPYQVFLVYLTLVQCNMATCSPLPRLPPTGTEKHCSRQILGNFHTGCSLSLRSLEQVFIAPSANHNSLSLCSMMELWFS